MIDTDAIATVDFTHAPTIRLISTAYIDEPALAPLVDHPDHLSLLAEIEAMTSRRQDQGMPLPSGVAREELLSEVHGFGWTYVNAAFCYTRPTGNRFNGPERGAWYATWGDQAVATAQAEVSWHLTRELEATNVFENITAYRELVAGFTTVMHDLHGFEGEAFLHPDPKQGYGAGQTLARALRGAGANGVIYPSMRHEGGQCLAAFRPHMVQNIRQGLTWRFTWAGSREPRIERMI
jgi:hypothetical protein